MEENKVNLARLLRKPEDLSCQAVDGDSVAFGGFESPELVTCSPDHDPGILSATHVTYTHILFHAEAAQRKRLERVVVLCIERMCCCCYFISNINYRVIEKI